MPSRGKTSADGVPRPPAGVLTREVADHLTIVVTQCVYFRSKAAQPTASSAVQPIPSHARFGGHMLKTTRIGEFLIVSVFLAVPHLALAQAAGASLTGQVTDPAGAAILNASVSLQNIGTSLTNRATSDAQGVYRIAPLSPATYTLTVTATGFSTYVQQGIVLTVGLSATQNVTLKVGST